MPGNAAASIDSDFAIDEPVERPAVVVPSIPEAIRRSIPARPPQGRREVGRAVFQLIRNLHGVPGQAEREAEKALQWLREWIDIVRGRFDGEAWNADRSGLSWDQLVGQFVGAWDKVRVPIGCEQLRRIFAEVKDEPDPPGVGVLDTKDAADLAKLCRALQRHHGDHPFYLSARLAGETLGFSTGKAHALLRSLQAIELIKLVTLGRLSTGKASEYFWTTSTDPYADNGASLQRIGEHQCESEPMLALA